MDTDNFALNIKNFYLQHLEDELEDNQINEGIYLKGCNKLSKTSNEDMILELMVMLDAAKEIIIEQINYYNHEEYVDVVNFYSFV